LVLHDDCPGAEGLGDLFPLDERLVHFNLVELLPQVNILLLLTGHLVHCFDLVHVVDLLLELEPLME